MLQAKPGDTCDVKTVCYVNEEDEQNVQDARSMAFPHHLMFQPKEATPLKLVCSNNPNKEMNYLVNQEYTLMKEKQELRYRDVQQKNAPPEVKDGQVSESGD